MPNKPRKFSAHQDRGRGGGRGQPQQSHNQTFGNNAGNQFDFGHPKLPFHMGPDGRPVPGDRFQASARNQMPSLYGFPGRGGRANPFNTTFQPAQNTQPRGESPHTQINDSISGAGIRERSQSLARTEAGHEQVLQNTAQQQVAITERGRGGRGRATSRGSPAPRSGRGGLGGRGGLPGRGGGLIQAKDDRKNLPTPSKLAEPSKIQKPQQVQATISEKRQDLLESVANGEMDNVNLVKREVQQTPVSAPRVVIETIEEQAVQPGVEQGEAANVTGSPIAFGSTSRISTPTELSTRENSARPDIEREQVLSLVVGETEGRGQREVSVRAVSTSTKPLATPVSANSATWADVKVSLDTKPHSPSLRSIKSHPVSEPVADHVTGLYQAHIDWNEKIKRVEDEWKEKEKQQRDECNGRMEREREECRQRLVREQELCDERLQRFQTAQMESMQRLRNDYANDMLRRQSAWAEMVKEREA